MAAQHIVIVEDEGRQRRALRQILTRMGLDVAEAASVSEGYRLLTTRPEPRCLILDLMLPDGRGESLLEYVRSQGWKTYVVVTTGIIGLVRFQNLERLKPDEVLIKPLTVEAVWSAICEKCECPALDDTETSQGPAPRSSPPV